MQLLGPSRQVTMMDRTMGEAMEWRRVGQSWVYFVNIERKEFADGLGVLLEKESQR